MRRRRVMWSRARSTTAWSSSATRSRRPASFRYAALVGRRPCLAKSRNSRGFANRSTSCRWRLARRWRLRCRDEAVDEVRQPAQRPRRPAQQCDPAPRRRHAELLLRDGLVVPLEHHTEAGHDGVERRRRIRDGHQGHRPPSRSPRHAGRPQCGRHRGAPGIAAIPVPPATSTTRCPPCSGQRARGFGRAAREGPGRRPSAWSTTNIAPSVGLGWLRKDGRLTSDRGPSRTEG